MKSLKWNRQKGQRNMKKRFLATMMAAIMMFAMSTTAFAAETTSWKNYDFSKYTSSWGGVRLIVLLVGKILK